MSINYQTQTFNQKLLKSIGLRYSVYIILFTFLLSCSNGNFVENHNEINTTEIPQTFDYCPNNQPERHSGYELVWSDNFNSNTLDIANWNYMYGDGSSYGIPGWGNNEDQNYVDSEENIYTYNGCLYIIPTFNEDVGFESARINSSQKHSFQFGRIDVAFSVPELTGVWPAIWMLPEYEIYGNWPASGEIDLMETKNKSSDELVTTIHYGHDFHRLIGKTTYLTQLSKLANPDDHNVISIVWNVESIEWLLNNSSIYKIKFNDMDALEPNPFIEEFHSLINVAVGGNFPGNANKDEYCASRLNCPDVKKLIIDYIAYYESAN
tara:strand:- start:941 stop:1906 length:966 start_codon:yes stop_codon:yes gene_type:complete